MTNAQRREIINSAKASGYQGSYVDLFRQAEISPDAYVASTPEQYQDGLRTQHAAGNTDASMAFPDVPPNTPFNTHGMKVPIDIKKYDEQGHLVKSYESVPPGVDALNTGPSQGTVIETPSARLQWGNFTDLSSPSGPRVPALSDAEMSLKIIQQANAGNPAARRMRSDYGQRMFLEGETHPSTHYMASFDKYAVPLVQEDYIGGPLSYNENPAPSKADFKFDTPEQAEYFARNYKKATAAKAFNKRQWGDFTKRMQGGEFLEKAADVAGYLNPATAAVKLTGKAMDYVIDEGKKRLADNIYPFGYVSQGLSVGDRVVNALMGNAEEGSVNNPRPGTPEPSTQERNTLFRQVLGVEGDTLPKSEYRENAYRSPVTEANLTRKLRIAASIGPEGLEEEISRMESEPGYHGGGAANVLGNYTVTRGEDEKGKYIDYYDVWDLNPSDQIKFASNPYLNEKSGSYFPSSFPGSSTINRYLNEYFSGNETEAREKARKAEDFVFDKVLGLKSPEIYGRIYLDDISPYPEMVNKKLGGLKRQRAQGGLFFSAFPSEGGQASQVSPEMQAALAQTGLANNPILQQQAANPIATPSPQKSISQESVNYEGPKTSTLKMAANPLKTARYVSEHGLQKPTTAEWNNTTDNAMDMAIGVVNPASWVQSGIDAVGAAKEGNYGEAALNALGAAPGLKAVGSTANFAKTVAKNMPKTANIAGQIMEVPNMKSLPGFLTQPANPIGKGIRTVNNTQARVSNVANNATNMFMQSAPVQSFMGTGVGQAAQKGMDLMSRGVDAAKKPGQMVMDWASNTTPGQAISTAMNTPVKVLGGETIGSGLNAYGTAWAVSNAPRVADRLIEGDVGGAASHLDKLPVGRGVQKVIKGAKMVNDFMDAGEGVYDIARGEGDKWDVAGVSKLLPGTSKFRIGVGIEDDMERSLITSRRNGGLKDRRGVSYSNRRYKR